MKKQKISYKNCNLKALRHLKKLSANKLALYAKIIEAFAKVDQQPKNVYYTDLNKD